MVRKILPLWSSCRLASPFDISPALMWRSLPVWSSCSHSPPPPPLPPQEGLHPGEIVPVPGEEDSAWVEFLLAPDGVETTSVGFLQVPTPPPHRRGYLLPRLRQS